jgi:DNA-binding LacI/PurR family transcriptional regulator
LLIAHIEEGAADDDAYARLASTNRVDGLLVTTLDDNSVVLKAAKKAKVPFVLLNRSAQGVRNSIYFDSAAAARMAVEHLIKLGHRRIAHLSGQLNPSTGIGRFAGYRDALLDAGIPYDQDLVAVSGYTIKGGADAMHEILRKNKCLPTAVFPITLSAATGALMALHQHGIRVPEDMSLATVHDGPIAQVMYPPLTTVQMPVEQMGYDGVVSLIELIQGRRKSVDMKMSPIQLIIRGSTTSPTKVAD